LHSVHDAAVCLVVQGRKQVAVGDRVYRYGGSTYLVVSVDVPVTGQVTEASEAMPYLCLRLDLDRRLLGGLVLGRAAERTDARASGLEVAPVTPSLRDAATRLLGLLDQPSDIPVLAPLIERELLYRLLTGPHASALRRIAVGRGHTHRVVRAIDFLRGHYREPIPVARLAAAAAMSPSTFHAHFKAVTGLSPLQYQKLLRLQEARRLMLHEELDAASAAYRVGYESPSQFSREYRRHFGKPPARDVAHLRETGGARLPLAARV
jgi:AraC-like DNA-binding protein